MTRPLSISYDQILDTALRGVRRAAVFMGLGLNAALDPDYSRYQLTPTVSFLQFMPEKVSEEDIARFKDEFSVWIVGNGLRELIESFGVFLDQLHAASLAIRLSKCEISSPEAKKRHSDFTFYWGLKKKLESLRDDLGISTAHIEHLASMQKVRTCLTHRRGIVGKADLNQDSTLVLRWIGLCGFISSEESCASRLLDLPLSGPVLVQKGETIIVAYVERTRRYPAGTVVKLKPSDVAEMCLFMVGEAKVLLGSAVDFARSKGIDVRDLSKPRADTQNQEQDQPHT